jgi:hypothetical protein
VFWAKQTVTQECGNLLVCLEVVLLEAAVQNLGRQVALCAHSTVGRDVQAVALRYMPFNNHNTRLLAALEYIRYYLFLLCCSQIHAFLTIIIYTVVSWLRVRNRLFPLCCSGIHAFYNHNILLLAGLK